MSKIPQRPAGPPRGRPPAMPGAQAAGGGPPSIAQLKRPPRPPPGAPGVNAVAKKPPPRGPPPKRLVNKKAPPRGPPPSRGGTGPPANGTPNKASMPPPSTPPPASAKQQAGRSRAAIPPPSEPPPTVSAQAAADNLYETGRTRARPGAAELPPTGSDESDTADHGEAPLTVKSRGKRKPRPRKPPPPRHAPGMASAKPAPEADVAADPAAGAAAGGAKAVVGADTAAPDDGSRPPTADEEAVPERMARAVSPDRGATAQKPPEEPVDRSSLTPWSKRKGLKPPRPRERPPVPSGMPDMPIVDGKPVEVELPEEEPPVEETEVEAQQRRTKELQLLEPPVPRPEDEPEGRAPPTEEPEEDEGPTLGPRRPPPPDSPRPFQVEEQAEAKAIRDAERAAKKAAEEAEANAERKKIEDAERAQAEFAAQFEKNLETASDKGDGAAAEEEAEEEEEIPKAQEIAEPEEDAIHIPVPEKTAEEEELEHDDPQAAQRKRDSAMRSSIQQRLKEMEDAVKEAEREAAEAEVKVHDDGDIIVPPPAPHLQTEQQKLLLSFFKPGRISIRLRSGAHWATRSKKGSVQINPYLKLQLGWGAKFPWKKSTPQRKTNAHPDLHDEIITFNILNPLDMIRDGDIQLTIEIWEQGTFSDSIVATVSMSTIRFFQHPFETFSESIPVAAPPGAKSLSSKAALVADFVYEEAKVGILVARMYEGRGLKDMDTFGKQDPYVKMHLGDNYQKQTRTVKGGGTNPYFAEEELVMWVDRMNWTKDIAIELWDEDVGKDDYIGGTRVPILPYMSIMPDASHEESFQLHTTDSPPKPAGELVTKLTFYPAAVLRIKCVRGRGLRDMDALGRQDPYVVFNLEGQCVRITKKTPVDVDGGTDPWWNHELYFDIVDQYNLAVEAWDQDVVGSDDLIGKCEVSLLPVYKKGVMKSWVTLSARNEWGGRMDAGDIEMEFEFKGPPGVAFPQLQPGVDAYDETLRVNNEPPPDLAAISEMMRKEKEAGSEKMDEDEKLEQPEEPATVPKDTTTDMDVEEPETAKADAQEAGEGKAAPEGSVVLGGDLQAAGQIQKSTEFSDEQIESAFNFLDLDKNGFIGANEIRHILVCMGELITDEEIDMMISMVDLDGDGQVSYEEFHALVTDADPSRDDFLHQHMQEKSAKEQAIRQNLDKAAGGGEGMAVDIDEKTLQRQRDMQLRESKRLALVTFQADNGISFEDVRRAFANFTGIAKEERERGLITFSVFCSVLNIEPIGEYRNMFNLFDQGQSSFIDFREFMLGLMNFVSVDRETRLRFIFNMYDERRTGYLTVKELEEILKGNHFQQRKAVEKKAATIMRQAEKAADNASITLNEFIVVSKKFPNLLFSQQLSNGNKGMSSNTSVLKRIASTTLDRSESPA